MQSFVCTPDREDGFDCETIHTVYGSGDVVIETCVLPSEKLPPLPRIGLQMQFSVKVASPMDLSKQTMESVAQWGRS